MEIDPLDAASVPVKHTALGRFCHEGAETVLNKDNRVVVYCGDDTRGEYVYRFVTEGRYDPNDRKANMALLSEGTLYAARFDADGTGRWLPLKFGAPWLTPEFGFNSQADVVIDARRAGDLLGATRMDRPEDVQPNPVNGKVYINLTNNDKRKADQLDKANPRPENYFGHIIELAPKDGDHAGETFTWEILVQCGNPHDPRGGVDALWNPATSDQGWFSCPDNSCVDDEGRLWIATDQGDNWARTGRADGLYGLETEGERRRTSKLFFRVPVGAELCGPCFTPDRETLFLAVQHPGADGTEFALRLRPPLHLQEARDALARFPGGPAAKALGAHHHQDRRRQDRLSSVIPAQAGIQRAKRRQDWIPAFAGMTACCRTLEKAANACELTAFPSC